MIASRSEEIRKTTPIELKFQTVRRVIKWFQRKIPGCLLVASTNTMKAEGNVMYLQTFWPDTTVRPALELVCPS